jgi:uncharacterized protein GlcG (DUF336 family)
MITLDQARTIIRVAFEKGAEMNLKPLSIVVLDAGGHPLAFERQDGSSPGRFEIARGKAYGAVMLGLPSSALDKRAAEQPHLVAAMNGAFGGRVVPVPGGILVRDGDRIVGAVGVTGDTSENDADAGLAGIEAAGLTGQA